MTGPEHYKEAEALLTAPRGAGLPDEGCVAIAHVHATLALVSILANMVESDTPLVGEILQGPQWDDVLGDPACMNCGHTARSHLVMGAWPNELAGCRSRVCTCRGYVRVES